MALQPRGNGAGFFLTVSFMDTQGDITTRRFELQSIDYATAVIDSASIVTAMAGVSASAIVGTSLSFVQDEDTIAFPAGADNSIVAQITVQLADSTEKASLTIPAPTNDIFASPVGPNANIVDLVDLDVVAYLQLFQVGGEAFVSDGELADFGLRGRRTTR